MRALPRDGCHSNHGTQRIPYDGLDEFCATCHDQESNAFALAQAIEEEVLRAREDLHLAEEALHEMAESGKPIDDEEFRMQAAITAFRQLAPEAGTRVHRPHIFLLLLIPVWFLALSAVAFARFKLREVQQEAQRSDG